jgi:hypothetical protein
VNRACSKHVPLPRQATKSIRVTPDAVMLSFGFVSKHIEPPAGDRRRESRDISHANREQLMG